MKNILVSLSLFVVGCNAGYTQQEIQCSNLCSDLSQACRPTSVGSFEYRLCYDYCSDLTTQQEVDNFQSCSECYMAIECNDDLYGSVCFPDCETTPL